MNDVNHSRQKKTFVIALMGLVGLAIALVSYDIASNPPGFTYSPIINNTNMYPGERTNDTVYWANESDLELLLIFQGLDTVAPNVINSTVSINGVVVQEHNFSVANLAVLVNTSVSVKVPRGANYSISNSTTVTNIIWREYRYSWLKV